MKNKYWKITPIGDRASCYVDENDFGTVESFMDGMSIGHGITIELVKMSEKKFESLPEYEG